MFCYGLYVRDSILLQKYGNINPNSHKGSPRKERGPKMGVPLDTNRESLAPQWTVHPWHATLMLLPRQRFRAHMIPASRVSVNKMKINIKGSMKVPPGRYLVLTMIEMLMCFLFYSTFLHPGNQQTCNTPAKCDAIYNVYNAYYKWVHIIQNKLVINAPVDCVYGAGKKI